MEENSSRRSRQNVRLVPPGRHPALLVETRLGVIPKGTPYVDLVFIVTGGDACGEEVLRRLWLTDRAMYVTRPELERIGMDPDNLHFGPLDRPLECEVFVAVRESNRGNIYSAVTFWRPIEPIEPDEAADEEVALDDALEEITKGFVDGDGNR